MPRHRYGRLSEDCGCRACPKWFWGSFCECEDRAHARSFKAHGDPHDEIGRCPPGRRLRKISCYKPEYKRRKILPGPRFCSSITGQHQTHQRGCNQALDVSTEACGGTISSRSNRKISFREFLVTASAPRERRVDVQQLVIETRKSSAKGKWIFFEIVYSPRITFLSVASGSFTRPASFQFGLFEHTRF